MPAIDTKGHPRSDCFFRGGSYHRAVAGRIGDRDCWLNFVPKDQSARVLRQAGLPEYKLSPAYESDCIKDSSGSTLGYGHGDIGGKGEASAVSESGGK